jgi:peptide/nickel transport system substrate-binding protein
MNFDEISMSIFDGIGRASPWPLLTATSAMQEIFVRPILPWLEDLTIELADGTEVHLWDGGYANRIADILRAEGRPVPTNQAELYDMFGYGFWAYNPEAATQLFQMAGLELRGDDWYFNDEPFVINLTYLADTEIQAGRGVQATFDQLTKFGFNCTIASESGTTFWENNTLGDWEIAGYWPTMFVTRDIANDLLGWDNRLIVPLGQRGSGQPTRWDNDAASELIREMSALRPDDPRNFEAAQEFFKIAIEDLPFIGFHSGVKFVPYNGTYWTNFPTASNPYNGPWWWWSCFKYIVGELQPTS